MDDVEFLRHIAGQGCLKEGDGERLKYIADNIELTNIECAKVRSALARIDESWYFCQMDVALPPEEERAFKKFIGKNIQ